MPDARLRPDALPQHPEGPDGDQETGHDHGHGTATEGDWLYPFAYLYPSPVVTYQYIGGVAPDEHWRYGKVETALARIEAAAGIEFRELRAEETPGGEGPRINIGIDLSGPRPEGVLGSAFWMPDSGDGYVQISEALDDPTLFAAVAVHEILHMLGARHVDGAAGPSIMQTGWNGFATLQARDLASLEAAFPVTDAFLFARGEARRAEFEATQAAYAEGRATSFDVVRDAFLWALDRAPAHEGREFWQGVVEAGHDLTPWFEPHAEETWPDRAAVPAAEIAELGIEELLGIAPRTPPGPDDEPLDLI